MTIPKEYRDRYGLLPETEVAFEPTPDGLVLRSALERREELAARLARAAGCATVPITTDEILRLTRGDE